MAEQIRHNVVDTPESTGGSPLVDVHATQATSINAGNGQPTATEHIEKPESTPTVNDESSQDYASSQPPNAQVDQPAIQSSNSDAVAQSTVQPSPTDADDQFTVAPLQNVQEKNTKSSAQLVNGLHETVGQAEGQAEDGNMMDNSADPSIGSDTDNSRADTAEQAKEGGKRHVRSESVKKPTTFSKVSVAKNFLAKAATGTPVVKVADKGAHPLLVTRRSASLTTACSGPAAAAVGISQPIAKPRLVAKSGSGLQNTARVRLGSETANGPDASKVWNKNRRKPNNLYTLHAYDSADMQLAVAPPPPRQFTDEELKQQYGIHLATRLQSDENGKESKWADIDDDEDDWAPETVVWMDGTKSTLNVAESQPVPVADLKTQIKPAEGAKPILTALKKPTENGPPKTILKPGMAKEAQQNGLVIKTGQEKPTLVAKSPAPNPAKSPWAPLPPVDKVSPIVINPPQQPMLPQQAPQAYQSQDARSYESAPAPPPREMAADTFDRSWREGERPTQQLFNSQSGRYEPAPENRRASVKPDSAFRKPSVLQRPSQQSVTSPAEPSAAFQTRSSGGQLDGPSWSRRRGSSVSQGSSLPHDRRMSVSRPTDLSPAPERRASTVIGHDMSQSPQSVTSRQGAPPVFPQQSAWQQQMPPPPKPGSEAPSEPSMEEALKMQKKIMREKTEQARKRRLEEEEREEAAKRERLKAKLAALDHAGESKKEHAAAAVTGPSPVSEKVVQPVTDGVGALEDAKASSTQAASLEAQVLPSPTATQTQPEHEQSESQTQNSMPSRPQDAGLPARPASSADPSFRQAPRSHLSPRSGSRVPYQQQSPYRPAPSSYSSPGDRKTQPSFGRSPVPASDAFAPWPSATSGGNVWGSSGIGNGTFGNADSFGMPMPQQQGSALPPPPGVIRPPTSTRISPHGLGQDGRSPNMQPAQVAEQHGAFATNLESRQEYMGPQRPNGVSPVPGMGRQTHVPGPIAPPSRAQQPAQRQDGISAWSAAATRLPQQYNDAAGAQRSQKEPQNDVPLPANTAVVKETFKQTSSQLGRLGGPRKFDKTEYTVHDEQGSRPVSAHNPMPPNAQTQPSGPFSAASPLNGMHAQPNENTVRIPNGDMNPAHGGSHGYGQSGFEAPGLQPLTAYQGNVNFHAAPLPNVPAEKDASPPPPETQSHPAFQGNTEHPNVRLPPPPPVVKLPPAPTMPAMPSESESVVMPQRPLHTYASVGARPIVQNSDWQARFNGLFNRTPIQTETPPSPPKTPPKLQGPLLAVAASSKASLDDTPAQIGATVSLPSPPQPKRVISKEGFIVDDSDAVISKPSVEPIFQEELSFGFRPQVRIRRNPQYGKEVYARNPSAINLLRPETLSKVPRVQWVDGQTKPDNLSQLYHPGGKRSGIQIKVLSADLSKVLVAKLVTQKLGKVDDRKMHDDHGRKASGKFIKSKGALGASTESGQQPPGALTPSGTPNTGSRKPSYQKAQTPTAMPSMPSQASTTVPGGSAASKSERPQQKKRNNKWAKPETGVTPAAVKNT